MKKKKLTDPEKQRLIWKISIWIGKPILIAFLTTISYGTFLVIYTNFNDKIEALFTIFTVTLVLGLIYYFIKSGSLFIDLIKDYNSSEKILYSLNISDKFKLRNKFYLETDEPGLSKIKTDKKTFDKIPKNQKVDLIISGSNRVYRYNPLIENFRIDKLL